MIYCDTSILVASTIDIHPHHSSSVAFLNYCRKKNINLFTNTHALAEFFNTMSRYPAEVSLDAGQMIEIVESRVRKQFEIITLATEDYLAAMKNLQSHQLKGPIIYDVLHYQSALKLKVKVLITWNKKDFVRISTNEFNIETPDSFKQET